MADIRRDVVIALVKAASAGMLTVGEDTTANEVFSAYLTMAAHGIEAAKEMGVPVSVLRNQVFQILVRCDDSTLKVM
jgi:methanogenic corrinoid protein MtbC1